jgi:hypothetical protein
VWPRPQRTGFWGQRSNQGTLPRRAEAFGILPRPIAGSISIRGRKRRSPGFKNFPGKAGCLAAVKTAQEGGEPKPAALRSELLRSVFLIFWGQKNELSIDR